jgi:hypothetical protein
VNAQIVSPPAVRRARVRGNRASRGVPREGQRCGGTAGRGTHVHAREHARGTRISAAPATTASARCRRRTGSAGSMPDGSSSTISERRRKATSRSLSLMKFVVQSHLSSTMPDGDADMQDAKVRLCAKEVLGGGRSLARSMHAGGGVRIRGALPLRLARQTRGGGGGRETARCGITAYDAPAGGEQKDEQSKLMKEYGKKNKEIDMGVASKKKEDFGACVDSTNFKKSCPAADAAPCSPARGCVRGPRGGRASA